ncbi:tetratricopeptide repeat protein [Kitasatospora sp. NPDC090091]|uniref:tetratricopeptide repeat protein n=1 Tax=Kitasatospora sp. NPDC090091 TaxID=3364081 RepID=UPI003820B6EA
MEITDERWQPPGGAAVRWGKLVTTLPRQKCQTWGVPAAAQENSDFVEGKQETGWINPGSGVAGNRYVMKLDGPSPVWTGRPGLPWAGLSGGAVLFGRMVVGVVVAESRHFGHGEVQVVPAYVLHQDEGFRTALKRYGADSPLLEPAEFRDLVDERSADPAGPKGSPTALLRAERQVVGFHGRDQLLDELVAWCGQDGLGAVLLHGPGGQGKTRLVRELARSLTEAKRDPDALPWVAVWLRTSTRADDLEKLRETAGPLLVVIDYAESRLEQLSLLLDTVRERRVPFKLVLIARTAGSWWERAGTASQAAEDLLGFAPVVELPPLAEKEADRGALYRQAAEAFARHLPNVQGHEGPDWPALADALPVPNLSRPGFENILTLHMTALADLLDKGMPDTTGPPPSGLTLVAPRKDADDVENRLLSHESRYWHRALATFGYSENAPERDVFKDALAAAVLLDPEDHRQADAVLRRVLGQQVHLVGPVDKWIAQFYPPDSAGLRPWGSLQPDRIAERFAGNRVLGNRRLLPALLDGIERAEAERLLTVLARAAHHRPLRDRLAPVLTGLCSGHPEALALAAITAATRVEEPEPILRGLRDLLHAPSTTPEDLAAWIAAVPDLSYNLGPWAVEALGRLVESLRAAGGGTPEEVIEIAVRLRELSKSLSAVGADAEALATGDEAIGLLRPLAADRSVADPFGARARNGLAGGLNNRANFLGELGRRQESLEAAEEAVRIFRELDDAQAIANPNHLVISLGTLAVRQGDLGHGQAALATTEEVVERRRRKALSTAEDDLADLALSLNNLSLCYTAEGRDEAALKQSAEAVDLLQPLADRKPDAYRPLLALALGTMSSCLGDMGRVHEALAAVRKAVDIRSWLAERRPAAYTADLAMSLGNLAVQLSDAGHSSEALARTEESVGLYRALAQAQPAAHTGELAGSLNNLANELASADRPEDALRAAEESAELYGELHRALPDVFAADHAMALISLGTYSGQAGRADQALAAPLQALEIYRSLPAGQADAARPGLAKCLHNIGEQLRKDGRPDEALARIEESVGLSRELVAVNPGAFQPQLARHLANQATCLRDLGRSEESVEAALEVVELLGPSADLPHSATSLTMAGLVLVVAGRSTAALPAFEAVVAARRRLAEIDPLRHGSSLVDILQLFGALLGRVGRLSEAIAVTEEVVGIRRQLWDATGTGAARAGLAKALGHLGSQLSETDRRGEALRAVEEAVALWRGLPEHERAVHGRDSALAQFSYAVVLLERGREDEALGALTEAAADYQLLPESDPTHHTGRAMVLTMRGSILDDQEDPAALEVLESAVAAARTVSGTGNPAFERFLANALVALAQCRADAEPPQPGALAEATEAVRILDRIIETEPVVYEADRARALPTLGLCLAQAGHTEEALATAAEAVEMARRSLAEDRSLADVLLAAALHSRAEVRLLADDRLGDARADLDEAIVLLKRRAEHEPALVERSLRRAGELRDRLTARTEQPD